MVKKLNSLGWLLNRCSTFEIIVTFSNNRYKGLKEYMNMLYKQVK